MAVIKAVKGSGKKGLITENLCDYFFFITTSGTAVQCSEGNVFLTASLSE